MEKYLEEQDIINMLVDFLREFQFERKYKLFCRKFLKY